jgi:hypothetical protein
MSIFLMRRRIFVRASEDEVAFFVIGDGTKIVRFTGFTFIGKGGNYGMLWLAGTKVSEISTVSQPISSRVLAVGNTHPAKHALTLEVKKKGSFVQADKLGII